MDDEEGEERKNPLKELDAQVQPELLLSEEAVISALVEVNGFKHAYILVLFQLLYHPRYFQLVLYVVVVFPLDVEEDILETLVVFLCVEVLRRLVKFQRYHQQ